MVARRRPLPDLSALVRATRTATASATCAASSSASTTSSGSAIDGIWLNPTMPSPNDDWGYDVADYTRRAPRARDARGPRRADRRGGPPRHPRAARPRPQPHQRPPRLVPGRAGRPRRAPPRLLRLGRPEARRLAAEQLDELVRRPGVDARRAVRPVLPAQLPAEQPDLNWWNEEVREAFDDILRFWFERGIAGFRIDVTHGIVKDRELRDDPAATAGRPPVSRRAGRSRCSR